MSELVICPQCKKDVTGTVVRAGVLALKGRDLTSGSGPIPVACTGCGTAMVYVVNVVVSLASCVLEGWTPGPLPQAEPEQKQKQKVAEAKNEGGNGNGGGEE